MDGTLLNSKSQISLTNAKALKEALSRDVKVVIATGKACPAAIDILKMVDLTGKDGDISEFSPGVLLQACFYSLDSRVPLIAFANNRCLTLFDHPLVESLHTVYLEPKAETMPSVEHLLAAADIQKMAFFDTPEGVTASLQPYWSNATGDRAHVIQAVPDMLDIAPHGTSKGSSEKMLLDHLGVTAKEMIAIGDGENDT